MLSASVHFPLRLKQMKLLNFLVLLYSLCLTAVKSLSMPGLGLSLDQVCFRQATADDIPSACAIEIASYPTDEAASDVALAYRQQHASPYFRCAESTLGSDSNAVIGYVCSTRCADFEHESMSTHDPSGSLLAIHSVVVKEEFRRQGVAKAMLKDYAASVCALNDGIEKIVLLAKSPLLGFYVQCGFTVTQPSKIVHGKDLWYDLEMDLRHIDIDTTSDTATRSSPNKDESWFVKTEQFCKPFPVVKPHLEAHRTWVADLRSRGYCVTSGYRVDAESKPGGGGLLFIAAKSFEDAEALVLQDPLVANDCVDWQLNGWIPEVGDLQLK